MKKRSFTLLMTALTVSATLLGTSPILAETKDDTATEETADKDAADTEMATTPQKSYEVTRAQCMQAQGNVNLTVFAVKS